MEGRLKILDTSKDSKLLTPESLITPYMADYFKIIRKRYTQFF